MKHFAKEFDMLARGRSEARVAISRASAAELRRIYPTIETAFGHQLATLATCEWVRQRHADNIWCIKSRRAGEDIGLYAMLMLTADGRDAMLAGALSARMPLVEHTAGPNDEVAAIYKWGVYAPGLAAAAIPLVSGFLGSPRYRAVDLYGNGSTEPGRKIMIALGFVPVGDSRTSALYQYHRLANRGTYFVDLRSRST